MKDAIADPSKHVVFSTSPSVRVGLGDAFLDRPGTFAEGRMVAALRALGADRVFDVTFSADLTIIEEGCELLSRKMCIRDRADAGSQTVSGRPGRRHV